MGPAIGIDLSGISRRTKGRTVAVALEPDPLRYRSIQAFHNGLASDRLLVDWVVDQHPRIVAIDAPITLPHAVMCADPGCERCEPGKASYLERDVDRVARKRGGAMPLVMLAAIAFRGRYLARQLEHRGLRVVETYPAASFRELGASRDRASRWAVLDAQIQDLPELAGDALDAACAALAAAQAERGGTALSGADGTIWLAARG